MNRTTSALRSTFEGDPADFDAALRTLRGSLADLAGDFGSLTDSLSPSDSITSSPATAAPVVISGPIAIYGVQDVESLYDQLNAEAKRRNV
jgi:hypothetical protein